MKEILFKGKVFYSSIFITKGNYGTSTRCFVGSFISKSGRAPKNACNNLRQGAFRKAIYSKRFISK